LYAYLAYLLQFISESGDLHRLKFKAAIFFSLFKIVKNIIALKYCWQLNDTRLWHHTNGGRHCGGGWALQRSAFRNQNDHQPLGSSYVSDTALL